MTPKGQKQITDAELEEIVPLVRARHKNKTLITLLTNAIYQLSQQDEDLEKATKAKKKKEEPKE